ncbi:MAG: hypothetical protein AB1403_01070 [Candidatus Riflebacteria bacterium]
MFDFIIKKFVPFGLARTLSLAGIPLLQFAVMYFCSREEAGKFYFVANVAFVATQIADLGMSRAFPVLFGCDGQPDHQQLPGIMLIRWILGFLLGLGFVFINQFGEVSWNWADTGLTALLFCLGRVILLGNQGYRHARQEFTFLLRGSVLHIIAATGFLAICAALGRFSADIALIAITLGLWTELVSIDNPAAHQFKNSSFTFKGSLELSLPFATVGIAQAVYGRVETFVAGHFLNAATLGVFGTLDSAFKMFIWPSYVSAQTVFPAINQSVKARNQAELKYVAKRHFKLAGSICIIAMVTGLIYWHFKLSQIPEITLAALYLWLSIWMSIPNAFMIPLYYSLGLEKKLAAAMLQLAIFRCAVALILAQIWGFTGLCATHPVATLCAIFLLWHQIKPTLRDFFAEPA